MDLHSFRDPFSSFSSMPLLPCPWIWGPLPHGDVVSPEGDRPVQLLPQPQQGPGEPLKLGSHVGTPLRACWRRPIKRPERITPAFNQASIAWRPAAKRGSSPKDTRTFPSASCVCVCVCERERERERETEREIERESEREREREREREEADEASCQHSCPRSPPYIPQHHTPSHLPAAVVGRA